MKPKDTIAIRKRTQIANANRTMFITIAIVSVTVGFAGVGLYFMGQRLVFNEKILAEKRTTVANLTHNNASVDELQDEIRALDSNEALMSARVKSEDNALQVILDALPSDSNSLALGASLQSRLLAEVPGLRLESLQVNSETGEGSSSADVIATSEASGESSDAPGNSISFQFVVVGNSDSLRAVMERLERSLRTIDIVSLTIESRGTEQSLTVQARAYYEPAKTLTLKDKAVQP